MKISVVTVVYNGESWIEGCIQSVLNQTHKEVEYIVVDGGSKDKTMEIVNRYKDRIAKVVSEKDKGIYDAMNKGVAMATGEVVGILNADDEYAANDVLAKVADCFAENKTDMVWGDVVIVKADNLEKIVRYYSASNFRLKDFERGDMPPHPGVFVKRELYEKFGGFNLQFRIVADYDWLVRATWKGKSTWAHLGKILVKMRAGGVSQSGVRSKVKLNREILESAGMNGIKTNTLKIYSKYFSKIFQFVKRPGK